MSSRRRAVAVVGAAGHVGRHLVGRLEEEDFDVHAVDRGDDLSAAVQSVDAIVHLAGTLKPVGGDSYRDANVATVERTLTAARDAAVRRLVLLSYPGADPDSSNEYLRTKGEAEALLRLSGIETVILPLNLHLRSPRRPRTEHRPLLRTQREARRRDRLRSPALPTCLRRRRRASDHPGARSVHPLCNLRASGPARANRGRVRQPAEPRRGGGAASCRADR